MKRLLIALCLVTIGTSALAIDTDRRGPRVGVLRGEWQETDYVIDALREELRSRGVDAFDARRTYEEWRADGAARADYYIEVVGGQPSSTEYGGVDVGGAHASVSLGIFVSRFAAEIRIYDGETNELLATHDLAKRSKALLPSGVGVGGRSLFTWVALPFIERAQWRRVARAAARDGASAISGFVEAQ